MKFASKTKMMINKKHNGFQSRRIRLIISFLFLVFMYSCLESDKILNNNNYNEGDWFFVNVNYAEKTLQFIDDEKILEKNKDGIWIKKGGDCASTTCDGFLMLFKDGKLISKDEYLTRSLLQESNEIKHSYINGIEWTIDPKNTFDFNQLWDSLISVDCYPTLYHTQPADKDIIWVYGKK